ncbi:alginate export family protein [Halioxenophilus sp. WMMB6]|uniref:alginate export family protein n=1 Tax=Halioxenophilus sp. WMMB6 TaxID=3073815 RepID=UPI00295F2ED0|nr:alginate export family protein [Halioxenophilus sp. WMMB6]
MKKVVAMNRAVKTVTLSALAACAAHSQAEIQYEFHGETRLRFEHLDEQFRNNQTGSDQALLARTLLGASASSGGWTLAGEIIDARELGNIAKEDSNLNTSTIDPLDILQLNVQYQANDFLLANTHSNITLGRFTMNLGSRRLAARNNYRNTINAFEGALWQIEGKNSQQLQLFYTHPVARLIDGPATDNDPKRDEAITSTDFWGAAFTTPLADRFTAEFYGLRLNETDSRKYPSRNRQLTTVVASLQPSEASTWYWQTELAYQWGESRSSTSSDVALDHSAYFGHFELGPNAPVAGGKLRLQLDIASGDRDPTDDNNNRFDTLYGARRFDFGPTSLYGAFARANIISPGIRWQIKSKKAGETMLSLRHFELENNSDSWTSAGISPAAYNSNTAEVGQQLEVRWRWHNSPKNLLLELGAAYLFAGELMQDANKDDSTYTYSQITYKF